MGKQVGLNLDDVAAHLAVKNKHLNIEISCFIPKNGDYPLVFVHFLQCIVNFFLFEFKNNLE